MAWRIRLNCGGVNQCASGSQRRRGRDSNPRYVAVHTISSRAPSTTRSPLRVRRVLIARRPAPRRPGEAAASPPHVPLPHVLPRGRHGHPTTQPSAAGEGRSRGPSSSYPPARQACHPTTQPGAAGEGRGRRRAVFPVARACAGRRETIGAPESPRSPRPPGGQVTVACLPDAAVACLPDAAVVTAPAKP